MHGEGHAVLSPGGPLPRGPPLLRVACAYCALLQSSRSNGTAREHAQLLSPVSRRRGSTLGSGRGTPCCVDERTYESLASEAFKQILDLLDDVDPDDVDVEHAGDVVTLLCSAGQRIVLNTQRPARQIWLAGDERAWHFSYDSVRTGWFDEKRPDQELLATISSLVRKLAGVELGAPASPIQAPTPS